MATKAVEPSRIDEFPDVVEARQRMAAINKDLEQAKQKAHTIDSVRRTGKPREHRTEEVERLEAARLKLESERETVWARHVAAQDDVSAGRMSQEQMDELRRQANSVKERLRVNAAQLSTAKKRAAAMPRVSREMWEKLGQPSDVIVDEVQYHGDLGDQFEAAKIEITHLKQAARYATTKYEDAVKQAINALRPAAQTEYNELLRTTIEILEQLAGAVVELHAMWNRSYGRGVHGRDILKPHPPQFLATKDAMGHPTSVAGLAEQWVAKAREVL
jgi:hypothetical protein